MKRWFLECWLCFFSIFWVVVTVVYSLWKFVELCIGNLCIVLHVWNISIKCLLTHVLTTFKIVVASSAVLKTMVKISYFCFLKIFFKHATFFSEYCWLQDRKCSPKLTYGKRPTKCFLRKKISLSDFNRKDIINSTGVVWQITLEETVKSEVISPPLPIPSCLLWALYFS